MFWADRIAGEIEERFKDRIKKGERLLLRDEKTASGRVHVGSMRGVAIHGLLARVLRERGVANEYKYEINDFDPFDGLPSYLPAEQYKPLLGGQLYKVPSPDPSATSLADLYGNEFKQVITESGYHPTFYYSKDLYLSGAMDEAMRLVITHAERIREIYKEVSGSQRVSEWLPISVICERCGKVSMTQASDFDGETVAYTCVAHELPWGGIGCGHSGRVSPFGGRAKLPWKPEWAAKWYVLGVDIEGAGKDHSTKGGARDVANAIARDVFHIEPPFDVPYEFFLVGGQKMSSSKGRGSSARDIADLVPPKLFRLALLGKEINQAFNFDAQGETIPVLYDLYDKLAEGYKAGAEDDYSRLFSLIETDDQEDSAARIHVPLLMRFSQVAFMVQMPHVDLYAAARELKGAPLTDADTAELDERAAYAKRWLTAHAPEKYRFALSETLPQVAAALTSVQKEALTRVAELLESATSPEELHTSIHALKDELSIAPAELFAAIYLAFFGKAQGPKAGWLLFTLPRQSTLARLREAAAA